MGGSRGISWWVVLFGFALGIPAAGASAATTTIGVDLSQAPNVTFDCTVFPLGNGGSQPVFGDSSSCTWATATGANNGQTPGGMLTPAGDGTITNVRVRVGPTTGPMRVEILQLEEQRSNAKVSCCTDVFQGPAFTPAANSVTTLPENIPVHTDGPGQESSPGLAVGDVVAISILEDHVPIPAINETSIQPQNLQPTDITHFPAYSSGETDLYSGTTGYQLDMNADWVPKATAPPVSGPPATNPNLTPTNPTIGFGGGVAAAVKGNNANVTLTCGGKPCVGTIAIQNAAPAGATLRAHAARAKPKTVTYASGSFSLAAGTTKSVAAKLTSKGKALAKARKKLKVFINLTLTNASPVQVISHAVTLKF